MTTVRSRRAGSASAANRRLTGRSSRRSAALTPVLGDKAIKPKPGPALNVARPRNITYCGDCETSGRGDVPSPHRRFFTATRACDVDETAGWRMDSVLVETPTAPLARAPARPAPELSVIVPTFNERANIPLLVARLPRTPEGGRRPPRRGRARSGGRMPRVHAGEPGALRRRDGRRPPA